MSLALHLCSIGLGLASLTALASQGSIILSLVFLVAAMFAFALAEIDWI